MGQQTPREQRASRTGDMPGEVRAATAAEWDEAYSACPHATYFQSRDWLEDWADYTGGTMTPEPLMLAFGDGRTVVLPLTRQRKRRGLSAKFLLSPAGTYGGWLAPDPLSPAQAQGLVTWLEQHRQPFWWRVNPYDPCAGELAGCCTMDDVTHAIPLTGPGSACDQLSHSQQCAVNKARREGLCVRRADGAADWETYYALYEQSLARWGSQASSRYGPSLFELLRRRSDTSVDLWLVVTEDDLVVAGGVCLYGPRHAAYWHAAALAEFFPLRPANLLVDEMVREACRRGLSWFDLNPSGGHAGVVAFKERLGAVALPAPVIEREGGPAIRVDDALRRVKSALGAGS